MKKSLILQLFIIVSIAIHAQNELFELYSDNNIANQSATSYGNYLFSVKDKLSSITLYNLDTRSLIYTLKLSPYNDKNEDDVSVYHCNQCCFGRERFSDDDFFPLLYISQRNPSVKTGALINVYRVIPHLNEEDVMDSFSVELVQNIYLPVMTDENSLGNPNAVIDVKKGYLYTYSRNNRSKAENYGVTVISKFKLPALRTDGVLSDKVYLTDNDILDRFSCDFKLFNAQGGFFRKGRIYIAQGYPSAKYVYFREINVKKKKQTRVINMLDLGFNEEPEGVWYYDGYVMIAANSKNIYKLTGKEFKVK